MKLPNVESAYISPQKITSYLLNLDHDEGHGKAQFFLGMGFTNKQWEVLAQQLIRHANEHEIAKVESTRFGVRYVIEGIMEVPIGRIVQLRSVWFLANNDPNPRLVTAYPIKE